MNLNVEGADMQVAEVVDAMQKKRKISGGAEPEAKKQKIVKK